MKNKSILAVVIISALAWSCKVANTCPTYAKGQNQSIEKTSRR